MLFEARGKVVSGGVDVTLFSAIAEGAGAAQQGAELWRRLLRITHAVEELPVPTVFAAHGLTLTAAFELALACDLLLAAERASFGLVERVVGLAPSMGGPQRLAERAGPARAKELVYTGRRYPAATLERWNVVNEVLPDEGFAAAVREYVHDLAAGPTLAHAVTARLVTTAVRDGVRAADDITPAVSGALFGTADLRGAVASFLSDGTREGDVRGPLTPGLRDGDAPPAQHLQRRRHLDHVLRERAGQQLVGAGQPADDGVAVGVEPLGRAGDAAQLAHEGAHGLLGLRVGGEQPAQRVGEELVGAVGLGGEQPDQLHVGVPGDLLGRGQPGQHPLGGGRVEVAGPEAVDVGARAPDGDPDVGVLGQRAGQPPARPAARRPAATPTAPPRWRPRSAGAGRPRRA